MKTDEANIDSAIPDLAARTELHSISTLTLTDTQFLRGDTSGKPTITSGQLRLPKGSGPMPVVVLQHGSAGMAPNVEMWTREFNRIGVATFALDGFTGRGLTELNTNQALLGRLNFIVDIYRALDVLARHPGIDRTRIALMGFSRGGQATLYAGLERFHRLWNTSGVEFAAYIPFYPDCMTTFLTDTDVVARPIRIFGGLPDDYNPIAACKSYVERLRAAGADVELTVYPNAAHAFDNPLGAQPATLQPRFQSARNCRIQEQEDGLLVNMDTSQPFAYTDACVAHGVHTGHDPVATRQAQLAVKDLLKKVFQLH